MESRAAMIQILFLISISLTGILADSACSGEFKGPTILPNPDDCTSFFICHSGHQFQFSCATKVGPKKAFDPKTQTCVLQGSEYDNSLCKYADNFIIQNNVIF